MTTTCDGAMTGMLGTTRANIKLHQQVAETEVLALAAERASDVGGSHSSRSGDGVCGYDGDGGSADSSGGGGGRWDATLVPLPLLLPPPLSILASLPSSLCCREYPLS